VKTGVRDSGVWDSGIWDSGVWDSGVWDQHGKNLVLVIMLRKVF